MASTTTLLSALTTALLLASTAAAEPAGHYDPDKIPPASRVFVEISKVSGGAVPPIERALVQADGALAELELALGLSAGSIDPGQHEVWSARLEERSTRFFAEAEGFQNAVYAMGDGFQRAFEDATTRAVAGMEGEYIVCQAPAQSALGALAGKAEPVESSCPGENVTTRIAAAWDADPELATAVAPMREPLGASVTSYDEAQPVLEVNGSAGTTWVLPQDLAAALPEAAEILDAIDSRADSARGVLRDAKTALKKDDPLAGDIVKAIRNRARGVRAWTEERRAALGTVMVEAIERNRKRGKKAGWSDVAICVNPEIWAGCAGTNAVDQVTEALLKDKKLVKALERMLIELAEPETALE